jgi:hypothetical protein
MGVKKASNIFECKFVPSIDKRSLKNAHVFFSGTSLNWRLKNYPSKILLTIAKRIELNLQQ